MDSVYTIGVVSVKIWHVGCANDFASMGDKMDYAKIRIGYHSQ
jgi:hypothetical protein